MNIFIILIFVIIFYLFYNYKYDYFTLTKFSNSDTFNDLINNFDRDAPVINPIYTNIIPKLLSSSNNLNLPGQSNGKFENQFNYTNKNIINKKSKSKLNLNPKALRENSGHLIRPIEIDYSPSINSCIEKPYIFNNYSHIQSKFLEYDKKINSINLCNN